MYKIKVYGMMLTCNELEYLHYSLQSVLPHVDKLLIYDVSNDGSKDYLKSFDNVIVYNEEDHPELISLAEKRQFLLERGREFGATHYICIDADEVMSNSLEKHIYNLLMLSEPGQKCFVPWYHIIDSDFNCVRGGYIAQSIIFMDNPDLSYINVTSNRARNHTHEYRAPYKFGIENNLNDIEIGYYPLLHFGRDDLNYLEWKNVRSMIGEYIDCKIIEEINFRYLVQETVTVGNNSRPMDFNLLPRFLDRNITLIRRDPELIKQSIKNYIISNGVSNDILYKLDILRNKDIADFFINNIDGFDISNAHWVHDDGDVYLKYHYYELLFSALKTYIRNDRGRLFIHIWDFFKYRIIKILKL